MFCQARARAQPGGPRRRRDLPRPCQEASGPGRTGATRTRDAMIAIIQFIFFIIGALIELLIWAIIINAILSWLVAFDVINLRNRFVYNVANFLDRVTAPIMRPVQRIIPTLGGVDISPIIVILILMGLQRFLLPALQGALIGAFI